MGRGLSDLQKTILRRALANRDAESRHSSIDGLDLFRKEILTGYDGRSRSVQAVVTRATGRLEARGLVVIRSKATRDSGLSLTAEGIRVARAIG
jgi:hypothetical protein